MAKCKPTQNNENMKRFSTWYSQDKETYQKWAQAKRLQTKFTQEHLTQIYDYARDYVLECREKGKALTISGLQLATHCNKMDYSRMRSGEYDWRMLQFAEYKGIDLEHDITPIYDDLLCMTVDYWISPDGEMFIMSFYSDIIDRFYLLIQEQTEELLYKSPNPRGPIFILKAVFGFNDRPQDQPKEVIAPLHIATREEAERARKELMQYLK